MFLESPAYNDTTRLNLHNGGGNTEMSEPSPDGNCEM